jgi:hypothetical protein
MAQETVAVLAEEADKAVETMALSPPAEEELSQTMDPSPSLEEELSHGPSSDDFDPAAWDDGRGRMPPSPRTCEACLSQGIEPHELRKKELCEFRGCNHDRIPKKIARMRHEHYERRRVEKLQAVLAARELISEAGSSSTSVTSSAAWSGGDWIALKRREAEKRRESEARRTFLTLQAVEKEAKTTNAVLKQNEELNARLAEMEVRRAHDLQAKQLEEAAKQRERLAKAAANRRQAEAVAARRGEERQRHEAEREARRDVELQRLHREMQERSGEREGKIGKAMAEQEEAERQRQRQGRERVEALSDRLSQLGRKREEARQQRITFFEQRLKRVEETQLQLVTRAEQEGAKLLTRLGADASHGPTDAEARRAAVLRDRQQVQVQLTEKLEQSRRAAANQKAARLRALVNANAEKAAKRDVMLARREEEQAEKAELRRLRLEERLERVGRQDRMEEYKRQQLNRANEAADAAYWANKRAIQEFNEKARAAGHKLSGDAALKEAQSPAKSLGASPSMPLLPLVHAAPKSPGKMPGYTFGTKFKGPEDIADSTPGPATASPQLMQQLELASLPRNPSWSWGKAPSRTRPAKTAVQPAPPFVLVSNEVLEATHFRSSPKYSMGLRHAYALADERPGTTPGSVIRAADHPARRPGPASYDVEHTQEARMAVAPRYSFSRAPRGVGGAEELHAGEKSPGPSTYNASTTFVSSKLAFQI